MLRLRHAVLMALAILAFSCETSDATRRAYQKELLPLLTRPAHPVIVIPGFGNARLFDPVTRKFVWGTPRNAVRLGYEDDLDLPLDPLTGAPSPDRLVPLGTAGSRGPVNVAWRLTHALTTYGGYPRDLVYVLDYDWRLDATDATRRLDELIDRIRRERRDANLTVDVVAHSAGGAIASLYAAIGTAPLEDSSRWDAGSRAASKKIRNVVLLSTPQRGTAEAFRVLVRGERFIRRELPPTLSTTFPLLVELLPFDAPLLIREDGSPIDTNLFTIDAWRKLGISIFAAEERAKFLQSNSQEELGLVEKAFQRNLVRARLLHTALLHHAACSSCVTTIAGDCVPTAKRVLIRRDGSFVFYRSELRGDETRLASLMFEPGDGSITRSSATDGANDPRLFCDGHQGIASDPEVHREILRVLLRDRQ